MFALYGGDYGLLGKGAIKAFTKATKKTGTMAKTVVKKSGTAVKKTVLPSKPHPTKPAVKVTLIKPSIKPSIMPKDKTRTAVPLIKVVSKKPLTKAQSIKATKQAATKTLKKAASNIAEKKGVPKAALFVNPRKTVHDVVTDKIQEIAQKTQPQIFPDVPPTPAAQPSQSTSENFPVTTAQDSGMSQGKILAIAGGVGLLAFMFMGKKGR